jgi:hypothetical protein
MNKLVFTAISLLSFTTINAAEEIISNDPKPILPMFAPTTHRTNHNNVPGALDPYIFSSGTAGNVIVSFQHDETLNELGHLLTSDSHISFILSHTSAKNGTLSTAKNKPQPTR